ncbi:MAG: hypothetical protein Q8L14_12625 [Myxococcales bacterium]|nr:hypothetical protein [Myxococcales bacterium]
MAASSLVVDAWLSTLWRAAFVATQATDSSLSAFEFSLRVGAPTDGHVDAPSSGLLTASTFAALIRGKKLLPDTTVTGAVNPDGTACPVDEVLPRLRAAALDGVKRFGFPMGGRHQVDVSGAAVDLVVEGQRLGVVVQELRGLDDAYLFMTGEALPRGEPAREADMELWPAELAAISRSTAQVRAELETERAALEEAFASMTPTFAGGWRARLERATRQATDFEKGGDPVRALVVWSAALAAARVAVLDVRLVQALDAHETERVIAQLQLLEEALPVERRALRREIEVRFPNSSRANDLYAMDLLESVNAGVALRPGETIASLRALEPNDPAFAQLARKHAEDLVRAREELENGRRFFTIYASLPKLKNALTPIDAERLSASYVAGGAAAYASLRARPSELFSRDETALELTGYQSLLSTETDARARLVLAARQGIYASYLVNAYPAVGAGLDSKGVFAVRNARALALQLEQARLRALQACGRARREAALIPFAARLRYLNARAAREGTDRQKTESIADLWISTWWCEVAVVGGR